MSVLWAGNMRVPRLPTPGSVLLLLLLLLTSGLRHTVLCEEENTSDADNGETEEEEGAADGDISVATSVATTTDTTGTENGETTEGSGGIYKSNGSFDVGEVAPPETTPADILSTDVTSAPVDEGLGLIIIVVPVVLVVFIIAIIVCSICIHRKMNSKTRHSEMTKEDPYLDGSSTEKVPMPMFEEDVPSVLELEMEELDDWIKKDGEGGPQLA